MKLPLTGHSTIDGRNAALDQLLGAELTPAPDPLRPSAAFIRSLVTALTPRKSIFPERQASQEIDKLFEE